MKSFKKIGLAAAPALAILALSGCATPFKADVARFQQLPAPAGQSFIVVADDPALSGGLEFSQYAALVGQRLSQTGYVPAADPARTDLIIRVAYRVDNGREKVRSTGFGSSDPFFYGGWGWRGRWGRPWGYGFYDPWLFGPGYNDVSSYTVYTSDLSMKIDRASDRRRLFEGKATAQSLSNRLTYLVPNLIDAMFTGFPGRNGENVKITLPPDRKG